MRQKWDLRLGGRCRAVQPDEFERVRWHDAGIHHGALIAHRDNDITQDVQGPLFHDAKKPQADRFFRSEERRVGREWRRGMSPWPSNARRTSYRGLIGR